MNEDFNQKVHEALTAVFGVMFFIPIEPLRDSPPRTMWSNEIPYFEARIDVHSYEKIPAYFFFPEELVRKIAFNYRGMEDSELSNKQLQEVVEEAVQMTVGGLLGKIDPEAKCRLGSPAARSIGCFSPGRLFGEPGTCVYETEFGYLWIDLGDIEGCN